MRVGWKRLLGFITYVVGDGRRVHFCHDVWCGDIGLKELFPDIFLIIKDKKASVYSYLSFSVGRGSQS